MVRNNVEKFYNTKAGEGMQVAISGCPACGSAVKVKNDKVAPMNWYISCPGCGISSRFYGEDQESVVESWERWAGEKKPGEKPLT
jgi:ribosomal protein S27AE